MPASFRLSSSGRVAAVVALLVCVAACGEEDGSSSSLSCLDVEEALLRSAGGLCGEVTVRRSATGLAHIEARGLHDLVWAQGYETARDRIFHMDHFRRFTYGTRAEVFGPRFEADDRTKRVFGLAHVAAEAEAWWRDNDAETWSMLQAYANGVNAYIDHMQRGVEGAERPAEFDRIDPAYVPDPWTPADVLAVLKIMLFGQTFQGDTLLFYFAAGFLTPAPVFADLVRFEPLFPTHILEQSPTLRRKTARGGTIDPFRVSRDILAQARELSASDRQVLAEALGVLSARLAEARGHSAPGATGGSNAWALDSAFAGEGSLLCNDPHMGPDLPTTLYPVHLVDLEVDDTGTFGFGVPGLPLFLIGHNDSAAWGMTNAFGDVTDIVRERIISNGTAVRYQGEEVPLVIREEVIRVRREGGGLEDLDEVVQVVRVVPHRGPILNDILPRELAETMEGLGYTFSTLWTGFAPDTGEPLVMRRIHQARDLDSQIESLRRFDGGIMSFTFADREGEIGYVPAGPHPQRTLPIEEAPPYQHFDGTAGPVWEGFLPFDEIPRLVRPAKGYVVNANNAIGEQTLDNRPETGGFYFGHFFDLGTRAHRITERIEGWRGGAVGLSENLALQTDAHAGIAEVYLPHLLALQERCGEDAGHPLRCEAFELLAAWDMQQRRDSVASTLYNAFFVHLAHNTYSRQIDGVIYPLLGGFLINLAGRALIRLIEDPAVGARNYFGEGPPSRESVDNALLEALDDALEFLADHFGPDVPLENWRWGEVHVAVLRHPVWPDQSLGPLPMDGSVRTVLAADFSPVTPGGEVRPLPWQVNEIAVMRYCTSIGPEGARTRAVLAGGVSGHFADPHYGDQFEDWLENRAIDVPFRPEAVRAAATSTHTRSAGFGQPASAPE